MPQVPFQPEPGLFTDTTQFAAKGAWVDGYNVRFWNGLWQVIGGWTKVSNLSISSGIDSLFEWAASNGNIYLACGGPSALKVKLSTTLYDIKPALEAGPWTFATYGDTLIANPTNSKIYQWSLNTAIPAAQVTNAPTQVITILVTPQRQLLAIGCNEVVSGTFNGRCIRCSDIENITSWTPTATNNSDEIILDTTSTIVTAKLIGDYVAVWTTSELFLGQYIGEPGQSYRFERVADKCGAISLNGVVVANGTAYWLTQDRVFKAWQPGAEPVTIDCPIINDFRTTFPTSTSDIAKTFAAYVAQFNEIWFTYNYMVHGSPVFGSYVAFSLTDGKWFKGNANRTAMHQGLYALYGATSTGGWLIICESGQRGLADNNTDLQWYLYSSDIYLDAGQRRMMIRSLRPDFNAQSGNITVTVKVRDYPTQGTISTTAPTVTTSTTKKDFRKSGKLVSLKIAGDDGVSVSANGTLNTFARQGLPVFDVVPMGER